MLFRLNFTAARPRRTTLTTLGLGLWLFVAHSPQARAHDPFSSSTRVLLDASGLELQVTLSGPTALDLLDRTAPGIPREITAENFEGLVERLNQKARDLYAVSAGAVPLKLSETEVNLTEENEVDFRVFYARPTAGPLRFRALYLNKMPEGHIASLYVEDAAGRDLGWGYLEAAAPTLEIPLPGRVNEQNPPSAANARPRVDSPAAPSFGAFLKLGIKHILTGFDHLLFLAGLLIACRRFRTMAGIITCFTVAHSLTLALAACDVLVLPGRVVEPLIAASIVFVGIENLLRRGEEPSGRWALTFGFGLVHGFGFAGALKAIGLGAGGAPLLGPLFSFNLGVELGQVAVAAIFLPLLFALRRFPNFVRFGLPAASSLVTFLGSYWLIQRIIS